MGKGAGGRCRVQAGRGLGPPCGDGAPLSRGYGWAWGRVGCRVASPCWGVGGLGDRVRARVRGRCRGSWPGGAWTCLLAPAATGLWQGRRWADPGSGARAWTRGAFACCLAMQWSLAEGLSQQAAGRDTPACWRGSAELEIGPRAAPRKRLSLGYLGGSWDAWPAGRSPGSFLGGVVGGAGWAAVAGCRRPGLGFALWEGCRRGWGSSRGAGGVGGACGLSGLPWCPPGAPGLVWSWRCAGALCLLPGAGRWRVLVGQAVGRPRLWSGAEGCGDVAPFPAAWRWHLDAGNVQRRVHPGAPSADGACMSCRRQGQLQSWTVKQLRCRCRSADHVLCQLQLSGGEHLQDTTV